jgi:glycosyltransferase involved in cell wall biosynthesis
MGNGRGAVIVANNMVMEAETAHVLQTCQMLGGFARLGCDVTYLWPDFGRTVPVLAGLPIRLAPIRCRNRLGAGRYAEFLARLLPALRRCQLESRAADGEPVVLSRSLGVALAGQMLAPRLVLELHNDLSPRARSAVPFLGRHLRWVAISGNLREHLIRRYGLAAERVAACHDAVDYAKFAEAVPMADRPLPVAVKGPVHLYYGTLRPERGLDLIRAAAEALPDHGFVLVGGGAGEVAAALALGLDRPNVRVLPALPHAVIPALVRAYDSVLLPYTKAVGTHQWMSPLKLFEVLASGTPAVVSRLGPICEVVDDRHAAFLDPERPETLVEALRGLAADPAAARARAQAGQSLAAERFTWERRAADILDLARP